MQSRQQSGDLSLQILIISRSSAQVWLDLGFTVNCVKTVAFLHIMPCNSGDILSKPGVSLFRVRVNMEAQFLGNVCSYLWNRMGT
jgi:hypothetical protein